VAERLQNREVIEFATCSYRLNAFDMDLVIKAIEKVFQNLDALRDQ
jgi:hypothetical protein